MDGGLPASLTVQFSETAAASPFVPPIKKGISHLEDGLRDGGRERETLSEKKNT